MPVETNKEKLMGIFFLERLTSVEKDVFYSMTEGNSYLEAAKQLNIKVSILKKHRESICDKLRNILEGECNCNKSSRVGLSWFRFAVRTDIIDLRRWLQRAKIPAFVEHNFF